MSFCEVFKRSQKYLKKDIFFVMSLRRLENILKKMSFPWRLWDVLKTSLGSTCDFSKIAHKNDFVWFSYTKSDKKDVGPLETVKKWNGFWKQCIDINQVYHEYQWADFYVRVLASQWSSKPNIRCIIYYFQRFFSTDKIIYNTLPLCRRVSRIFRAQGSKL